MKTSTNRRHLLGGLGALAASAFIPAAQAAVSKKPQAIDIADIVQIRTLGSGQAAMQVTALGFGCMGMSHDRSETPDKAMLKRVVAHAHDLGVNFFDTAQVYGRTRGQNERLVGEAIAPFKNNIQIATKFGFIFDENDKKNRRPLQQPSGKHPPRLRRILEKSRR